MTGRRSSNSSPTRPKRRAANTHFFRYLQTNNPIRLEENDLKRALEASLEESPEFWIDDSTSSTTDTCSSVASGSCVGTNGNMFTTKTNNSKSSNPSTNGRQNKSANGSSMQTGKKTRKYNQTIYTSPRKSVDGPFKQAHLMYSMQRHQKSAGNLSRTVGNDFFHEGIMEYIAHHLLVNNVNQIPKQQERERTRKMMNWNLDNWLTMITDNMNMTKKLSLVAP